MVTISSLLRPPVCSASLRKPLLLGGKRGPMVQRRRLSCIIRVTDCTDAEEDFMIVSTTENIAGHRIKETMGQVFGLVVRSRGLGGNIVAGLRSIVGGEIHEYTQLLEETRRQAVDRLVRNATAMGADAVTMMRFDSSEIGQTMSEIVAYGTAVKIEPL